MKEGCIFRTNYIKLEKPREKTVIRIVRQEIFRNMKDKLIKQVHLFPLKQDLATKPDTKRRFFMEQKIEIAVFDTSSNKSNYILILPFLYPQVNVVFQRVEKRKQFLFLFLTENILKLVNNFQAFEFLATNIMIGNQINSGKYFRRFFIFKICFVRPGLFLAHLAKIQHEVFVLNYQNKMRYHRELHSQATTFVLQ